MKNFHTLKGIFPTIQPTTSNRDFLKENKLKLKDIQTRRSNKSQQLQQQQQQQKEKSEINLRKRVTINSNTKQEKCKCSGCVYNNSTKVQNSKCNEKINKVQYDSKGIQTDDISDEEFLSNALKRCLSKDTFKGSVQDTDSELPSRSLSSENENSQRLLNSNHQSNHETIRNDIPDSAASNLNLNLHDAEMNRKQNNDVQSIGIESFKGSIQQSSIRKINAGTQNVDNKNKTLRSNVKIPKYLEREKREKELQKQREMERDPHCPKGHYVLDENERLEALNTAKERFQKLIDELNHMPLTCKTLKQRNRKIEIEKSLSDLEKTINIFSKQKIYVKESE